MGQIEETHACSCPAPEGLRGGPSSSHLQPSSLFREHPLFSAELVLAWNREAWGLPDSSGFGDPLAQETFQD